MGMKDWTMKKEKRTWKFPKLKAITLNSSLAFVMYFNDLKMVKKTPTNKSLKTNQLPNQLKTLGTTLRLVQRTNPTSKIHGI